LVANYLITNHTNCINFSDNLAKKTTRQQHLKKPTFSKNQSLPRTGLSHTATQPHSHKTNKTNKTNKITLRLLIFIKTTLKNIKTTKHTSSPKH